MAQTTRVVKLAPAAAKQLLEQLREALPVDAEWRQVPHASFSVKSVGVVATCYTSGKLVVQGADPDLFLERFVGGAAPEPSKVASPNSGGGDAPLPLDRPTLGSDEAGKGDYFGPLVVAAVHATEADAKALSDLGVTDSKALSDSRARLLAGRLEELLDHRVVVVQPADYNRRHAAAGNLNVLLADLHAEALGDLAGRHPDAHTAVVDRFANEKVVAGALANRGIGFEQLIQVPRAERHAAVAAASILARAAFLDGLDACAEACGTDLHKGAGEPVDVAARRVVAIGGEGLLGTVAKLHFKNTGRVL